MKLKPYFFLLFVVILMSCLSKPSQGTKATLPSPISTKTSLPNNTQTPLPAVAATPTLHPLVQQRLIGAEVFLPSGGQPLYHQVWTSSASDGPWGGVFLPYRVQGGTSLLVLGQQRQEDNSWNGENQILVWDWQNSKVKPMLWQEIRPVGRGQSSFFGLDQDGHWWAVIGKINWEIQEFVLLGVIRVASLDEIPTEKLSLYPAEELDNLQIERIDLFPTEENTSDIEHFIFREENKLILYQMEDAQAHEIWSTDRVIPGRFHAHSNTEPDGSLDMTGDGLEEILIVWDVNFPPLIDIYQFVDTGSEILHWLGRVDSTWQYIDVNGDGISEFLQPDDPDNSQEWQVTGWNGETFTQSEKLLQPQPISPSPISVTSIEELPILPGALIFQEGSNHQWYRWPQQNGSPEIISEHPNLTFDSCAPPTYGGYGEACYSPAGRFKMIYMTPYIEGHFAGILDGITGKSVIIPGSFVYTQGYNTFAWSSDEKFLLFARGDGIARLAKINPVSGESRTVWIVSLCGLDIWDCTRIGDALAITDPIVFEDGSLGFVLQSAHPALYPPPGIYRFSSTGELSMLASLPFIDETKGSLDYLDSIMTLYGHLIWSPDKSTFLYYDLFVGDKSEVRILLLGKADGSALWDLREVLPDAQEFYWER